MQILFIGDLHIGGKTLKKAFRIPGANISTRDASILTLKRAISQFQEEKPMDEPGLAIFAGDVVDGPHGKHLLGDFLKLLKLHIESGTFEKVIIFPGNHDYEGDRLIIEELKNYNEPEGNILFLDKPTILTDLLNQRFVFLFFPYIPGTYTPAASSKEFTRYLDQAKEIKFRENLPIIVFSHGGIKEISESVGTVQDYDFLPLDDLKEGADYTFLGHVHKPPKELEAYRIFYSGIIEPLKTEHTNTGYLRISISQENTSPKNITVERKRIRPTVRFVTIKEKPSRVVEAVKRYFEKTGMEAKEAEDPALVHLSEVKFFSLDQEEREKVSHEIKKLIEKNQHLLPLQGREPIITPIPQGVADRLMEELSELKSILRETLSLSPEELQELETLEEEIKWVLFFNRNEELIENDLKIQF